MKKISLLLLLIVVLIITAPVSAQTTVSKAPGTWKSSLAIFNPGGTSAEVILTFYDSFGEVAYATETPIIIEANKTLYLYTPAHFGGLSGGQYSLVASSSTPVTIVASQRSSGPRAAGSYTGFGATEVSNNLYFPGLYKDYYTFNSELVIQNTVDVAANIVISFYKQQTGAKVAEIPATIPRNATKVFSLQDLPAVPSGKSSGLISAHVLSDQPIVGVGDIWSSRGYGLFSNYNSFSGGTTNTLYVPALYNNYYNFVSALTVQNIDPSQTASITVTYSNGQKRTATLSPNKSIEFFQPNDASLPSGNRSGYFSAKVSTNGVPIVAFVSVEDTAKGLLASYNAAITPAQTLNCSLVYQDYFDWFSAQTVQNVGSGPTNITISYSVGTPGQYSRTFNNVPANGTINIIELPNAGSKLPNGTVASAVITSSAEPIISVVQMNNETVYSSKPGDYLEAYTCTSIPAP